MRNIHIYSIILLACLLIPSLRIFADVDVNNHVLTNALLQLHENKQIMYSFLLFGFYLIISFLAFILMQKFSRPYQDLPEGLEYVGLRQRCKAEFIDVIIAYILSLFISSIMHDGNEQMADINYLTFGAKVLVNYLYRVIFQMSKWQATLGMMIMGYRIYDERLNRAGFWRLSGRCCAQYLSAFILLIGYFMIAWTKRKQALHDIIARTVCVRRASSNIE